MTFIFCNEEFRNRFDDDNILDAHLEGINRGLRNLEQSCAGRNLRLKIDPPAIHLYALTREEWTDDKV